MRLLWTKSEENRKKTQESMPKIKYFWSKIDTTSLSHSTIKDGIQIQAYKTNKESTTHFRNFTSTKVKKLLRKSKTRFREKLRKLRFRQNDGFLKK